MCIYSVGEVTGGSYKRATFLRGSLKAFSTCFKGYNMFNFNLGLYRQKNLSDLVSIHHENILFNQFLYIIHKNVFLKRTFLLSPKIIIFDI